MNQMQFSRLPPDTGARSPRGASRGSRRRLPSISVALPGHWSRRGTARSGRCRARARGAGLGDIAGSRASRRRPSSPARRVRFAVVVVRSAASEPPPQAYAAADSHRGPGNRIGAGLDVVVDSDATPRCAPSVSVIRPWRPDKYATGGRRTTDELPAWLAMVVPTWPARPEGAAMKAAVVRSFDRPLEIEEVPIPVARYRAGARPDRDLRALPHRHPRRARRMAGQALAPFIPGHEGVGVIETVGAGNMHGLEPGMRVALPWLGYACGDASTATAGARRCA